MSSRAVAPPALSHLQPYLDRAEELRPASVTVAYHLRVLAASAGLAHSGVVAAKRFLLALMGETAWKPVDVRCCPVSSSLPRARLALARTHAWRTARGFASNGA